MSTQPLFLSDTPQTLRQGTGGCVTNLLSHVELRTVTYPHPPPDLLITSDTVCSHLESCAPIQITMGRQQSAIPYCLYDVILKMRVGEIALIPLSFSDKLECVHLRTTQLPHSYTAVQLVSFKRHEGLHAMSASELLEEAGRQKLSGNELFRTKLRSDAAYHYSMAVKLCVLANSQEISAIQLKKVCILNLSACWLQFGQFERAVDATQKVIEIEPNNEKALYRQAVALRQLNELDRALCNINKLLAFNPNNREVVEEFELIRVRQKESFKKEHEKYSKLFS